MHFKFKEKQVVKYNLKDVDGTSGIALVKGVAQTCIAPLGASYILEDLSGNFPSNIYPYSCFACFEIFLEENS